MGSHVVVLRFVADGVRHHFDGVAVVLLPKGGFGIAPDVAVGGEALVGFVGGQPFEPEGAVLGRLDVGPGHGGELLDDGGGVHEVAAGLLHTINISAVWGGRKERVAYLVQIHGGDEGEAVQADEVDMLVVDGLAMAQAHEGCRCDERSAAAAPILGLGPASWSQCRESGNGSVKAGGRG